MTIPSDVRPIVEETPPFMRATTFASMDSPGPFETHATDSYFNVTLPNASMTPAQVEGFMHSFNIGTVISTSVHEAYPGHYVQFLWSAAGAKPRSQDHYGDNRTSKAGRTIRSR